MDGKGKSSFQERKRKDEKCLESLEFTRQIVSFNQWYLEGVLKKVKMATTTTRWQLKPLLPFRMPCKIRGLGNLFMLLTIVKEV